MNTWWDNGENEGIDNDTTPLHYEAPGTLRSVKWEMGTEEE